MPLPVPTASLPTRWAPASPSFLMRASCKEECIFTTRGCPAACNRSDRAPATTQNARRPLASGRFLFWPRLESSASGLTAQEHRALSLTGGAAPLRWADIASPARSGTPPGVHPEVTPSEVDRSRRRVPRCTVPRGRALAGFPSRMQPVSPDPTPVPSRRLGADARAGAPRPPQAAPKRATYTKVMT
jgi:hypothetical protein